MNPNNIKIGDLEIEKTLVLSTCHISPHHNLDLQEGVYSNLIVRVYSYGFLIHVQDDRGLLKKELKPSIPVELFNLILLARRAGCSWLKLDCDGPKVQGLPKFDW